MIDRSLGPAPSEDWFIESGRVHARDMIRNHSGKYLFRTDWPVCWTETMNLARISSETTLREEGMAADEIANWRNGWAEVHSEFLAAHTPQAISVVRSDATSRSSLLSSVTAFAPGKPKLPN